MTTPRFFYFTAVAALGLFAGCSSDDQTDNKPHDNAARTVHHEKKSDNDDDAHNRDVPPRVGMTKSQVIARYGEPESRSVNEEGERWGYRLNFGEFALRGLNPFDFSGRGNLRFGQIFFGTDGRVKKFHWDTGEARD